MPRKKPERVVVIPEGPYIERHGSPHTITVLSSGMELIEVLAKEGASQETIGVRLGISVRQFKKMLADDDQDNPLRLAWERGRYALDFEMSQLLFNRARKGDTISLIYATKALLGWSENPPPQTQVGVQILLPAPAPDRESYARLIAERTEVKVITDQTKGDSNE